MAGEERTAESVAELVGAALGRPVRAGAVRLVGEGGDHAAWWIGDGLVARFADGSQGTERLRREVRLRNALRPRLPVAVPESVVLADGPGGPVFTVDVRLPGRSGEERAVSAAGEAVLGALVRALRAVPIREAAGWGVPVLETEEAGALAQRAARAARRLAERGEVAASTARAAARAVVPGGACAAVFSHADLKGEHLRVDAAGTVTGVLDWADAALADPAEDLAGLVLSVGAAAVARIADGDREAFARALAAARAGALVRLDDRLAGRDPDSPVDLLRAQLRRAQEPVG